MSYPCTAEQYDTSMQTAPVHRVHRSPDCIAASRDPPAHKAILTERFIVRIFRESLWSEIRELFTSD